MSYDLNVLVCMDEFPLDTLLSVLSEVGRTTERPGEHSLGSDNVVHEWVTRLDESSLFITLYQLDRPNELGLPANYRWRIGISANSGCTPLARWAQFYAAYSCITVLEGAVALDPQTGAFFDSPTTYWEFASRAITRWPGLPRKLRRLGLMSDCGMLKTDRSN